MPSIRRMLRSTSTWASRYARRSASEGARPSSRRPCRARRVDEDRKIVPVAARQHSVPQGVAARHVSAAERDELIERDDHWILEGAQAFHVEHHDLLERRRARAARQDLVELLIV